MISLLIIRQKDLTTQLFGNDGFDRFEVTEAEFVTAFRTRITTDVPGQGGTTWEAVRPVAYRILQGTSLPRKFHIVLKLSASNTVKTLDSYGYAVDEAALPSFFINIIYEREKLRVVSGCSKPSFTLDRGLDEAWDATVKKYLAHKQIDYEEE
jgi:hypothetical protein